MRTLEAFRDAHSGESILVCGLGPSLGELRDPSEFTTIGVNDIEQHFTPSYLLVLNREDQFPADRYRWIRESRSHAVFTCLDLDLPHPNLVKFGLGEFGGTDVGTPDTLPYTKNSPYVAICLAMVMGAAKVGLIGVDFTDDHGFRRTGPHPLTREIWEINQQYGRLRKAAQRSGIEIVNLSPSSRINSLPRAELESFKRTSPTRIRQARPPLIRRRIRREELQVVSYATTPLAGVPAILARCVSGIPGVRARCVWRTNSYGNGVSFQGDLEWDRDPRSALEALEQADIVVVHNGKIWGSHQSLLRRKPVVTLAHNYMWNVDLGLVQQGFPGLVVGQYQATLPEFSGWSAVPNPIPLQESSFSPGSKGSTVTICYTPSGKHDVYPRDHRLYWHSKGYSATMRVLEDLARSREVRLEVVRRSQVSHAVAMEMKRRSHVVIDECVTGSYHRSSLEGLSTGCVVVNGVGLRPPVLDALATCAGTPTVPFVQASLDTLEPVLRDLVDQGPRKLEKLGEDNRRWMERFWCFSTQWERFWRPAMTKARVQHGHRAPQGKQVPEGTARKTG